MLRRTGDMLPGGKTDPGLTAADNRLFVEAVTVRFRTGSLWRDLPKRFVKWNSMSKRFRRWTLSVVSGRVFNALTDGSGLKQVSVDRTVVQDRWKAARTEEGPKTDVESRIVSSWVHGSDPDCLDRVSGRGRIIAGQGGAFRRLMRASWFLFQAVRTLSG